jgi:hypothetical protein
MADISNLLSSYNKVIHSSVKDVTQSQDSTFLYSAMVTIKYSSAINDKFKNEVASYLSSLQTKTNNLDTTAKDVSNYIKEIKSKDTANSNNSSLDTSTKSELTKKVSTMVDSFNKSVSFAKSNKDNFNGAKKLEQDLTKITSTAEASLNKIGMKINEDGSITMDKEKFSSSLDQNKNETMQTLNDISNEISNKTSQVKENLLDYTKYRENNSYSSISNNLASNSKQLSNIYAGLMFDKTL